jgi:hypothetical protein
MKQADLSRALVGAGRGTLSPSAVSKIVRGKRNISGDEMLEVGRITSYPMLDRRIGTGLDYETVVPALMSTM